MYGFGTTNIYDDYNSTAYISDKYNDPVSGYHDTSSSDHGISHCDTNNVDSGHCSSGDTGGGDTGCCDSGGCDSGGGDGGGSCDWIYVSNMSTWYINMYVCI